MADIDICMVVHGNYCLAEWQVAHWARTPGSRLLLADNTRGNKLPIGHDHVTVVSEALPGDGWSHGHALDLLVRQSSSDIVGTADTDFFWLIPDIISRVRAEFAAGKVCVGCEGWYEDWATLNARWPGRAGHLAPVCWGMFVKRELALADTFVVTPGEGQIIMETGWRLRHRLIQEAHPVTVLKAFRMPLPWIEDPAMRAAAEGSWFFGPSEGDPWGVHFVKGSGGRAAHVEALKAVVDGFVAKW